MKIDVKTAVDNCAQYCNKFGVIVQPLYANDEIYERVYKCKHLDKCKAMIEALNTATIEIENIT